MILLGPALIRRGLSPETALLGSGDFAYLGPAAGDPNATLDPISRVFLLTGKLLSVRRIIQNEAIVSENLIDRFKSTQVALIDQMVSGEPGDQEAYEMLWEPQGNDVKRIIINLQKQVAVTDDTVREMIHKESVLILGVSEYATLGDKVSAIIEYMQENSLFLDESDFGLRDYLMTILRDADGLPAAFPTTTDYADFPDEWITPVPLDPTGVTRSWTILW